MMPVEDAEGEALEMFALNEASEAMVAKAQAEVAARDAHKARAALASAAE